MTDVMEPRPYNGLADWERMLAMLQAGRAANNGTYYVHTGDVRWWLYYPDDQEAHFAERIFLWEDGDALLGWCLLGQAHNSYDVFVAPQLRGSLQAETIEAWSEARFTEITKAQGNKKISMDWISEKDTVRLDWLLGQGFKPSGNDLNYYKQSLDTIADVALPEGCRIDQVRNEADAYQRAVASQAAFKSKFALDAYWPRYRSFTQSRVYEPAHDMMLVAPDGRCASFCVYWLDTINKVGLFEPVGTHPDFQGKGMGKALLAETLKRMKAEGMETAIVCAEVTNPASNRLYQSAGFTAQERFLWIEKEV